MSLERFFLAPDDWLGHLNEKFWFGSCQNKKFLLDLAYLFIYLFIYAPPSLLFRNPVDHTGMGNLLDGQGTSFFIKKTEIKIPVTGRRKGGKISLPSKCGVRKKSGFSSQLILTLEIDGENLFGL